MGQVEAKDKDVEEEEEEENVPTIPVVKPRASRKKTYKRQRRNPCPKSLKTHEEIGNSLLMLLLLPRRQRYSSNVLVFECL